MRYDAPAQPDLRRLPLLPVRHYIIQPLVELYGDCMVVLKVPWCCIMLQKLRAPARVLGDGQVVAVRQRVGQGREALLHSIIQSFVELYGDCMAVLKVSCCGIICGA